MENGYELEMAHRKMADFEREVAHDALVKELKKHNQPQSFWRRLVEFWLARTSQRPNSATNYVRPSSSSATKPK